MRIYIDTNWFLSHYQAITEPKSVLMNLRRYAHRIVLTDQTVLEFRRNRDHLLSELRAKLVRSLNVQPWVASVIRDLPEFRQLIEARDAMKHRGDLVARKIEEFLSTPDVDPIYATFDEVCRNGKMLRATDEIIARARVRKLRGQPPSSGKRDTIGDEIIWETLLEGCKEDLALVSADGDFLRHADMLMDEYLPRAGRHLLYVGSKLSEALARFGERSPELEALEKDADPSSRCPRCGAGDFVEDGYDAEFERPRTRCSNCGFQILAV